MAGEVQFSASAAGKKRTPSKVVTDDAQAAVAAAAQASGAVETVALSAKAPRWLLPSLIALLAGGGVGSGVLGMVHSANPTPIVGVTNGDVQTVAATAAKAESDRLRAESAANLASVTARLDRLDAKLDVVSADVQAIKVDLAVVKAEVAQIKQGKGRQ